MTGWWVCPELYLRRPFDNHFSSRLDDLLEAKANQGVQVLFQFLDSFSHLFLHLFSFHINPFYSFIVHVLLIDAMYLFYVHSSTVILTLKLIDMQIYILLYKEVSLALKINSLYSKKRLLNIHENVRVLRYPDRFPTGVYLWYMLSAL